MMNFETAVQKYNEIMEAKLSQCERNEMLRQLKKDMENHFDIPVFRVVNWGMDNREVYDIYKKVQKSIIDYLTW